MKAMKWKMRGWGVFAAVLICAMAGCGGSGDDDKTGSQGSQGSKNPKEKNPPQTPQTPISADFDFGNMSQPFWDTTAVTITPKANKSGGTITVYYEGTSYLKTTTVPQALGSYVVTFDVAATTGWNAVSGLHAGTLTLRIGELGETGPGGGKIFYRSETGFTMTDTNETCHNLEAAPDDMPDQLKWATSSYENTDITGTETAIGTGRKNTALILAKDSNAPAAKACKNYNNNGKTDWFLPSKDELNQLYQNRNSVGNMGTSYYGSSSQYNDDNDNKSVWYQHFSNGDQVHGYNSKPTSMSVRAVRAF